jgi:hypothetical protein
MAAPITSSLVALILSHGESNPEFVIQQTADSINDSLFSAGKL